jgi:hypothetical protein
LDKEKSLFPGPNHSGKEHEKKPVRLPVNRLFDLPTKDDQVLSHQCVFREQFGFASGQIGEGAEYEGVRWWLHPPQSACLEHRQAETGLVLDRRKQTQHE